MRYMFLIYLDETKFAGMTESQRLGFGNAMLDYDEGPDAQRTLRHV